MKKLLIVVVVLILLGCCCYFGYNFMLSAPSNEDKTISFYVNEGETYSSIAKKLKESNLIRNEIAYKIYLRFNEVGNLEYGEYSLNQNSSVEELIETLKKGSKTVANTIRVTFVEGKNMRYIISTITKNFKISEEEVLKKLSDTEYLDKLIEKYWFLTDSIKNKNIYYSLEGYLYPDTYEFYDNASVEDIFKTMLDNMEKKLSNYKDEIESSKYSIHEMITLASIIELEAGNASDRKGVAGVFYNRLKGGWMLGSDVTTYYAEKIDNWSRDLRKSELNACNSYNTRSTCLKGKLPVGPICNPGLQSIIACIEPTNHKYYYFVADKNGKTYFNETDSGHTSTVARLKREGLWINYEN